MRRSRVLLPLFTLVAIVACGGGSTAAGAGGTTATASTPRVARGGQNIILNSEIEAAGQDLLSAWDLIMSLRPTMLRPRNLSAGAGAEYGIVAYVDEMRLGDLEQLKNVMRATVQEIRYISATDATTRWGTGHSNGVIQVRIKR